LPDPAGLNGSKALHEVTQFVQLGPRDSGTPGAKVAAEYLARRLKEIGLDADIDEFTDRTPSGETKFRNVTGRLIGNSPGLIILVSHYDTKSGISDDFSGANDSGSSTGLLLALARFYKQSDWQGPSLFFSFVDGEECMKNYGRHDGLHGSRRQAAVLTEGRLSADVKAVIVLDMIGDRDLQVTIPRNCDPGLRRLALQCAHDEGVRPQFSLLRSAMTDDHVPFLEAGMPAIDLIDFQFGSAPGKNDYWHTPQDTLDKLSPDSLQLVGRVTIRMINGLSGEKPVPTRP
jgi:glutaminyl-peptide cyclotransferase